MQLEIGSTPSMSYDKVVKITPSGIHAEVGRILECFTRWVFEGHPGGIDPSASKVYKSYVVWLGHDFLASTEELWS